MNYTDMEVIPEEDQRLADALGQDVAHALGDAVDLSSKVKLDLIKNVPGGLFDYIKVSRDAAISTIAMIPSIDCSDERKAVEQLRGVQMAMEIYSRAVAFAQAAITGYNGLDAGDDEPGAEDGVSD